MKDDLKAKAENQCLSGKGSISESCRMSHGVQWDAILHLLPSKDN